jgi:hypothetical protein
MRGIRSRLTYSNVVATMTLFIALGGGAYAAITLPSNSVGTKQLKNKAVTAKKLGPSALALLKTGAPGPQGPKGDTGAAGGQGAQGPAGAQGAQGPGATRILLARTTAASSDSVPKTALFTLKGLTMYASCAYGTAASTKDVNVSADMPGGASIIYTVFKQGSTWMGDGLYPAVPVVDTAIFSASSPTFTWGTHHLIYENGTDTVTVTLGYTVTGTKCLLRGSAIPAS